MDNPQKISHIQDSNVPSADYETAEEMWNELHRLIIDGRRRSRKDRSGSTKSLALQALSALTALEPVINSLKGQYVSKLYNNENASEMQTHDDEYDVPGYL